MTAAARLALIKFGALGDVVRTTSLLRPLHKKWKSPEIWWFTSRQSTPLLERNPWISRVLVVERPEEIDPAWQFDLVIGMDEEPLALKLGAALKARQRFGATLNAQGKASYTADSRPWFEMSLLNRDADGSLRSANTLKKANRSTFSSLFCDMLKAPPDAHFPAEPVIIPDPQEVLYAERWAAAQNLLPSERLIGLNTSAGTRWPNKAMSVDKTLELVKALGDVPNTRLMLLGGPDEKGRHAEILKRSSVPLLDAGIENSLKRFIGLVRLCDAIVTSDSMALHLATAFRIPTVAFFGPTSEAEIDLYGRGLFWSPPHGCECFYLTRCTSTSFCLDHLKVDPVLQYLSALPTTPSRSRALPA